MKKHFTILAALIGTTLLAGCEPASKAPECVEKHVAEFNAAAAGEIKTIRKVVKDNPDFATQTNCKKATLLHAAVRHDQLETAKLLLAHGADVDAVTSDKHTSLHLAAQNGNVATIKILLAYGAQVNVADAQGLTVLDLAEKSGNAKAIALVKKHGGRPGKAAPKQ